MSQQEAGNMETGEDDDSKENQEAGSQNEGHNSDETRIYNEEQSEGA